MAGTIEKDVSPVTLLVHNAGEVAIVIGPWCRGRASKALDAAERCVLDCDFAAAMCHERVVVTRVDNDSNSKCRSVSCQFIQEYLWATKQILGRISAKGRGFAYSGPDIEIGNENCTVF